MLAPTRLYGLEVSVISKIVATQRRTFQHIFDSFLEMISGWFWLFILESHAGTSKPVKRE